MRIAFFLDRFPVISETFILRQITGLIDLGHEVDLYANSKVEEAAAVHPTVTAYRLFERTRFLQGHPASVYWEMPVWPLTGQTWLPGAATPIPNWRRLARAVPALLRCLVGSPRCARQVLRKSQYGGQAVSFSALYRMAMLCPGPRQYDVLHAHFGPVGLSFRFARELCRAPLVVSFHGFDFSSYPRRYGRTVYAPLFPCADLVTVNSDYTRRRVVELGCPGDKLRHLPVGLDPAEFPFGPHSRALGEPLRLLTVGRLVEIKGHEYAIRAVAKLRARHPDLRYDIVGEGPWRQRLGKLISELGLEAVVSLHGAEDGDAVRRRMSQAHLFLLCSVTTNGDQEGQGLVLQEAQASGLPVVATRHGAFPEGLLPGQSGYLVPERDVEALADRLAYLIEHPEHWPVLGRAGRNYVEDRYDIRRLNRRLVALYEEARGGYEQRNASPKEEKGHVHESEVQCEPVLAGARPDLPR